ncbi:MHS family MFS transporter (plasmid) [Phyllobacterium sp. 628]|uniref:MFS transporter n=1 Tax=Phyllobacterium sp. 628 TaxID=2718938 RepID=UPI0016627C95|nr:MFS transporter [Phyllobacterium sp. 628]QND54778.1 MHS family MFS transporter [Phyllobacterium sp. 628]
MHQPTGVKAPRKAALASWIGSAVEYYDFFIYGTAAALIFPKIFFSAADPQAATIASFATFGVAYIARPFGAVILGHIGDKFGRKKVLTFTLLLMGFSTFIIGCLPTYDHVGILAPILLVIARLLQGISAAGEQAGANSMTLEHAPPDRRAFFTSFTLSGTQAGLILATLVFIPIAKLPEADLLSWAWRIPFFLSLVVVIVGFWVRRTLPETPVFIEEAKKHEASKLPFIVLFKNNWTDVLRIVFAALISVVSTIFSVFTLSYAVNTMHIDRSTMLTVLVLANIVALGAIPAWAILADRIGRKPVFIFGALGCAVLIWPYIWAISQGNLTLIFVLGILLSGVVYSASNGVWPALYGEMFDTRVRLSGMAIGTQIGFALGGFAPTISAALLGTGPNGWVPVAAFTTATAVIAAISAATASETYRTPMEDLGKK